jgi:hypothetical protein
MRGSSLLPGNEPKKKRRIRRPKGTGLDKLVIWFQDEGGTRQRPYDLYCLFDTSEYVSRAFSTYHDQFAKFIYKNKSHPGLLISLSSIPYSYLYHLSSWY